MSYINPVISGFHPDPSICRQGDDFYLVTSTFEYFPAVPLFHSKDLVHWQQIGHVLNRPEQVNLLRAGNSGGIYAPTIRVHNDRFYMTTTNVTGGGNFYVYTDDPWGEWSDPIFVDQGGIDPDLFFDDNGDVYFTTSNSTDQYGQGAYQSKINILTGEKLTETKLVWNGSGGQYPEAPHIYKIDNWYYLMMAEGGTEYGHMETIARSKHPEGPYESCPTNPILSHRSRLSSIQSTGHADLIEDQKGNWWSVCLGVRPQSYPNKHHLGREVFLAPVAWNENGWPTIGNNGMIEIEMKVETLPMVEFDDQPIRDDFNSPSLALQWNMLRGDRKENYSLTERTGFITLFCSDVTLNDQHVPSFIGRRQQHIHMMASTLLEFAPQRNGDEAGLTVYMNSNHHYELAVTQLNHERKLIVRRTVGSLWKVETELSIASEPIELIIKADPQWFYFGFRKKDGLIEWLAQAETSHLSTELAGGFTGVYVAMYATGNGFATRTPAYYDWFDYKELKN